MIKSRLWGEFLVVSRQTGGKKEKKKKSASGDILVSHACLIMNNRIK